MELYWRFMVHNEVNNVKRYAYVIVSVHMNSTFWLIGQVMGGLN